MAKYLLTLFILATLLISGCSSILGPKESISIAGSTSSQILMEKLARSFMEANPDKKIYFQGGDSNTGINGVRAGAVDIALSSYFFQQEKQGLKYIPFVNDAIVLIVHPKNRINNLTREEIRKIYTGEITNWKELGGDNSPIHPINREDGSGTKSFFRKIIMSKRGISNQWIIANSSGAVKERVASDPNAIGYISLIVLDRSLKALSLEGIEPKESNIENGSYPLSHPVFLVVKEPEKNKPLVNQFISYVLSSEGQNIVKEQIY